jgi:serine/threonine-protein kinase
MPPPSATTTLTSDPDAALTRRFRPSSGLSMTDLGPMAFEATGGAAPLAPGQVLDGKYRVARPLGGGAMGLVYDGYHTLLEKAVAIKVLRPELAALEEVRDRFEAEARASAALGHPNIVSVTDMGRTPDGAVYFVMDRLRGETLGERLTRVKKLDVRTAIPIALDVLAGLEAAHSLRLVHRDLKPDNIFLARPPGGREIAKILDFGIAKALASVGRRARDTRLGLTVGTPLYMSPEQASAAPDIDGRADLYSMGVILYQMLAGKPPFDGHDAMAVLAQMMSAIPTPLGQLCHEAPVMLVKVVERAMNRDRNVRPATAGELAQLLQQATGATPSGSFASLPRDTTPPPIAMEALTAPVLLDLEGKVVERVEESLPPPPEPVAPAPPSGNDTYIIPLAERAAPRAPDPPPSSGLAVRQLLKWALGVPVVIALVAFALPRLRGLAEERVVAAPAETVLVRFEVNPPGSRLFLDGQPLESNPYRLSPGSSHTLSAQADGYADGTMKFSVDGTRPVRLDLRRRKPPR